MSPKVLISFVMSLCPHISAPLSLYKFSWNSMLWVFAKFGRVCPNLVKIGQKYRIFYLNTLVGLDCWQLHLGQSDRKKRYCCVGVAIVVTRTRYSAMLHVHCPF